MSHTCNAWRGSLGCRACSEGEDRARAAKSTPSVYQCDRCQRTGLVTLNAGSRIGDACGAVGAPSCTGRLREFVPPTAADSPIDARSSFAASAAHYLQADRDRVGDTELSDRAEAHRPPRSAVERARRGASRGEAGAEVSLHAAERTALATKVETFKTLEQEPYAFGLRGYQRETYDDWRASPELRALICYATGGGKTHVVAAIIAHASSIAVRTGSRVLVIAHRDFLIQQIVARLLAAGCPADTIGDGRENLDAVIQVTSVQAIANRGVPTHALELIVIDEAHHAVAPTYLNVIAKHPGVPVCGLTATPARLDGKPLGQVFQKILYAPTTEELIEWKHLARPRYYAPDRELALTTVDGVKIVRGDYNRAELTKRCRAIVGNGVGHWLRLANWLRTIWYAVSVEHATDIAEQLAVVGVDAAVISYKTKPALRARLIADFRGGRLTVLVNVELFGEGLDVPEARCVVLARPTKSLTMFRQQCGRVMRPGEVEPLILDLAGNVFRHDLPWTEIAWSLTDRLVVDKRGPSVRICGQCGRVFKPGYIGDCAACGALASVATRRVVEDEMAEMVEIAIANGIARSVFYRRVRSGWEPERAASTPVHEDVWPKWRATAEANGVTSGVFYRRVRIKRWDPEKAATSPVRGGVWPKWRATAEANGVSYDTFFARVNRIGWSHEKAASTPVHEALWARYRAAAEASGVTESAFKNRVNRKWPHEKAATAPMRKDLWPQYRATAEANGVMQGTFINRVRAMMWSPEKAATTPVQKTLNLWSQYRATAEASGVTYGAFQGRVRRNWPPEKAATTPGQK